MKFNEKFDLRLGLQETLKVSHFILPCGGAVIFKENQGKLRVEIPHFLSDNLFFTFDNGVVQVSTQVIDLTSIDDVSTKNNETLNAKGFLPLSKTQFENVYVFCSYLNYEFTRDTISVSPNHPSNLYEENYGFSDLMDIFKETVQKKVSMCKSDLIVPLSGGIDSRLLLDLSLRTKRDNIHAFSLGVRGCGDITLAKRVVKKVAASVNHKIFDLTDFTIDDLKKNYMRAGFLVPLDRLLGNNLDVHYGGGTILSGIYGDVVFGETTVSPMTFGEYIHLEKIQIDSDLDEKIVKAYSSLPQSNKLNRILLRCQKLTKVSLHVMNNDFTIISPFLDDRVVAAASAQKMKNLYPVVVKNLMTPELAKILHQTTISHFTHPKFVRYIEKRFNQLTFSRIQIPYYTEKYLSSLGVTPNQAPLPSFSTIT